VSLGDDGLGRLLVRVNPRTVREATPLEQPGQASIISPELGQLELRVCVVRVEHGLDGGKGPRFPALLDDGVVVGVGDRCVCTSRLVALRRSLG